MVEGIVGDDERRRLVLEGQSAEIGNERLHVVHVVGRRRVVEPLEHPLRDVDGNKLPHARRERESEQPRARAEIDDVVVPSWLGKLDDAVTDREKGGARGNLLPRLHSLVPLVRILAHGAYRSRTA